MELLAQKPPCLCIFIYMFICLKLSAYCSTLRFKEERVTFWVINGPRATSQAHYVNISNQLVEQPSSLWGIWCCLGHVKSMLHSKQPVMGPTGESHPTITQWFADYPVGSLPEFSGLYKSVSHSCMYCFKWANCYLLVIMKPLIRETKHSSSNFIREGNF